MGASYTQELCCSSQLPQLSSRMEFVGSRCAGYTRSWKASQQASVFTATGLEVSPVVLFLRRQLKSS